MKNRFDVTFRANLKEANSKISYNIKNYDLSRVSGKIRIIPKLIYILYKEFIYVKTYNFDIIYVHDRIPLFIYGIIAKLLDKKLVWHIHMDEGRGFKKLYR